MPVAARVARRIDEVRTAIGSLAPLPHAVVYVDAGAADAHNPRYIARLLRRVGVGRIQGFFTNATHQDWTAARSPTAARSCAGSAASRTTSSTPPRTDAGR